MQAAGAAITARFGHVVWQVPSIGHARRARAVGEQLHALPGVLEAEATASGTVRVEFDRDLTSEATLRAVLDVERPATAPGDQHAGHDHADGAHDQGSLLGPNSELIFALT